MTAKGKEAVREALIASFPDLGGIADEECEAILSACAAALDSEQGEGPWRAVRFIIMERWMWFASQTEEADVGPFDTEPEALAVCAALNRVGRR